MNTQLSTSEQIVASSESKDWWRGAVIYQIYPRSFQDTNNDGIGDIAGITKRLPYIAELGVDAVWISPIFLSPMKDFGYDISDHKTVDPMFGTLADFDTMIETAHQLGIKIIIDLVLSHTADNHVWFQESAKSKDNQYSDWYVWGDAKPDGGPPNNWLSIFGGPAWTWNTARRQYYLHNFLTSQPDLNFHCPQVREAALDVARYWLDKGVDGFRLDTINFYFCDAQLRDNPPLPAEQRNADIAPEVNPYNHQNHLYDKNQPENIAFIESFRALLDEYPAATAVGEVGDAQYGLQLSTEYTLGEKRMHMCYTFEFLSVTKPDVQRFAQVLKKYQDEASKSWACWAFSNHDVARHISRWGLEGAQQQKMLKLLCHIILSLRGSVCLYQGEELGLPEADVPYDRLQDPYGIAFWPKFKGRDGCRTPMPWEAEEKNAGFSTAEPWLPMPDAHISGAVNTQQSEDSLLSFYKQRLAWRKTKTALIKGTLENVAQTGQVLSFDRIHGNAGVHCIFNFGEADAMHNIAADRPYKCLESDASESPTVSEEGMLVVPAFGAVYFELL